MAYICSLLRILLLFILLNPFFMVNAQTLQKVVVSEKPGLVADSILLADSTSFKFIRYKPLLSFRINEKNFNTASYVTGREEDYFTLTVDGRVRVCFTEQDNFSPGWKGEVIFENISADTLVISNVIPFETDNETIYITGEGPPDLARAHLFRPGYRPVRVILPDNAWEMGYTSFHVSGEYSMCALARRRETDGGIRQRYQTVLPPATNVTYNIFVDTFTGEWQNGLRMMFRDRYLYDLEKFDNSLFERPDLAWIRESYLIVLQMAWDRDFYDRIEGKYNYANIIRNGIEVFDSIDVVGIWPTWPRLGLDQRNQWDLYRDLPGGTAQLRSFARMSRLAGTRLFIAYNPWDNSTRKEDHYRGMAQLIKDTEADGVVLDTRGSSSYVLQATADSVRKGVVMYSEGMAIPADMPGIISGRVHNAIYYSPELNLNKLIKPDFSIFRVCDVGEDLLHREIAIAFFNGYGTELNMFRPGGRNDDYRNDLDFLSRTTFILRQNNDAFLDNEWTPLIETTVDNVYVNRFRSGDKTIYTVLNMRPEGLSDNLFRAEKSDGKHWVSLWNHEILTPQYKGGTAYIQAHAPGWPVTHSGTRKEGSVDCIAELPDILQSEINGDSVIIKNRGMGSVIIWKGNPSSQTERKELGPGNDTVICVKDIFGYYEGKIVLQLIENKRLRDENILYLKGGSPWLVSRLERTERTVDIPPGMVLVPGERFSYNVTTNEDFIPYPDVSNKIIEVESFMIDKYPVTNARYYEFLANTGYRPADTSNYLKHWKSGMYRQGQDNYPVVYVSLEDMEAYASWAGKRLPTEAEWQLAAQGTDKRKWPWGNDFHGTYCNNAFDRPTPVDAFAKGQSPYGIADLVGNVWQMTGDMYFNGSNYFSVIRGGSYYKPESSWWYVQGGPQPLDRTQILLMVSPGFDRNATLGFRCVKDVEP